MTRRRTYGSRYWGKADTTRRIIDSQTFARNVRVLALYAGQTP